MIDLSYRIYVYVCKHDVNEKIRAGIYRLLKLFVNTIGVIGLRLSQKGHLEQSGTNEVVVSLTSFPERIDSVWMTIQTLMLQSLPPSKIILWLAEEQFPDKKLPISLIRLQKKGLSIKYCDDIKSHKKYYYSMLMFPDSIIVTCDDDVFYPSWTLKKLYQKHLQFPKAITCNWAHKMLIQDGVVQDYDSWEKGVSEFNQRPSHELVQIGYEGVLYPPHCLNTLVFNKNKIFEYAPTTDDLWLKAMAYLNDTKVVRTDEEHLPYFTILQTQKSGLTKINNGDRKNDIAIRKIQLLIKSVG